MIAVSLVVALMRAQMPFIMRNLILSCPQICRNIKMNKYLMLFCACVRTYFNSSGSLEVVKAHHFANAIAFFFMTSFKKSLHAKYRQTLTMYFCGMIVFIQNILKYIKH